MKVLRIFKSDRGIWQIEFERNGKVVWSSLRTRDEAEANRKRQRYERICKAEAAE
jgi:hypothetical protein